MITYKCILPRANWYELCKLCKTELQALSPLRPQYANCQYSFPLTGTQVHAEWPTNFPH